MDFRLINEFWFKEITPEQWFKKDDEFDRMISTRFKKVHEAAKKSELYKWRKHPEGRVAEVIVLDQFSRNMYRDKPESFAQDAMALALAQEAILGGHDKELSTTEKMFLYMPYMHSESLVIHEVAERLFDVPGLENNLEYEIKHKQIIEQFGRYPHRNKILGRDSTPEELEFLTQPGSSF